MRSLRLLIIAITAICVMALGVFAFVNRPAVPVPGDDDIIIKGGSLEIQCGKNHKSDNAGCLGLEDGLTGKFKHKQDAKHITQIVVKNSQGATLFDSNANANNSLGAKPEIVVTYK